MVLLLEWVLKLGFPWSQRAWTLSVQSFFQTNEAISLHDHHSFFSQKLTVWTGNSLDSDIFFLLFISAYGIIFLPKKRALCQIPLIAVIIPWMIKSFLKYIFIGQRKSQFWRQYFTDQMVLIFVLLIYWKK